MSDQTASPTSWRPAPNVCWEPCLVFHADDASELVCSGCGWSRDEHDLEPIAA